MLRDWSSPFTNDIQKPIRRKITNPKQFHTQEKPKEMEDEGLSDYVPFVASEPVQQFEYPKETYKPPPQDREWSDKLDYMIHLLEQQKDDKTGQSMEEIVLYGFLGVFVLFVLDSFVKTGKYYR
jgi:hypothetical protein